MASQSGRAARTKALDGVIAAPGESRYGSRADTRLGGLAVSGSTLAISLGALLTVALHLSLSSLYGYQRDELYFIACARHLAWGYVDQPPLIALITALSLHFFGDTLPALRVFPALAAGGLVVLAAGVTHRFGGGPFALGLTILAVALAPFDLAIGSLLTMNAFEPLLWLALTVLMLAQIDAPRAWRWVPIGVVIGVGILNKWSMAMFAVALVVGFAIAPARRAILVPGLGVASVIAAVIAGPNVAWQAFHGWPQLQVLHNAELTKNEHVSPLLFMLEQLPLMNPFCAPLWIAGLIALFRSRRYAGIAWAYVVFVGLELALHGKIYYVGPIYPALIAVGAVAIERATLARRVTRAGLTAALALTGCAIMPLATPALPLGALLGYQHAIDVRAVKMEDHPVGLVPQQFADQLGWDDLETTVARAVAALPPGERASAAILTGDYGQAAALDFLGPRDHLPPAISGHNQYFLWGPHGDHAAIVAIGVPRAVLAHEFRSIDQVATYRSAYVLPQNNNLPVYVCRGTRLAFARFWPRLRHYF